MRQRLASILVVLVLTAAAAVAGAPAASARPYCGQAWGSTAEGGAGLSAGQLTNVRAGRHACFDRLVLDIGSARLSSWSVRYVDRVVADGSGEVIPVAGGARLEVVANVPVVATDAWWNDDGTLVDVRGYRTFRELAFAGSYEGTTTFALGVRARLPFRTFVLSGPGNGSRLVVDVAHQWCAPGHRSC